VIARPTRMAAASPIQDARDSHFSAACPRYQIR
jgi:hypothetical protein